MEPTILKSNEYWGRKAGTMVYCPVVANRMVPAIKALSRGSYNGRTTKRVKPVLRNANGTPMLGVNPKWFARTYKSKR